MEIIIGRQGSQKMRITDPTVSRHHCRVTTNGDGTFTVENLSSAGTTVNGQSVVRASAVPESVIGLGATFRCTLRELLEPAAAPSVKPTPSVATAEFDISYLRRVWDDYNNTNIANAERQRKIGLIRTGLGVLTMCAMPTIFFLGPVGYVLTGIGVCGNIFSVMWLKNAEHPSDRQRRQEAFESAWVCPNPACGRTLPARNYRMLERNYKACPYCKCRYSTKS